MNERHSDHDQKSQEYAPGPIGENNPPIAPIGMFTEPFLFRLPLSLFVGRAGAAILAASWEVMTSGVLWAVTITLLTIEPLGMHLILLAGALIFPHSIFYAWFYGSRKRIAKMLWAWLVFCALGFALYLLWII